MHFFTTLVFQRKRGCVILQYKCACAAPGTPRHHTDFNLQTNCSRVWWQNRILNSKEEKFSYQRSRNLSYLKILTSSKKWTFPLENDPFRIFPPPFCILHHCTFHLTPKLGYNSQNIACTINCLVNLLRTDIPLMSIWNRTDFM